MSAAFDVVQRVYDTVLRDRLPRKWTVYDDIPARDARLFDTTDYVSPYKPGLRRAINEFVDDGDTVTLVGGGRGISSVWLAEQGASVHAYEAAEEMVEVGRETVELQGHRDRVTFHHALVGDGVDVFGSIGDADRIRPSELDTRDALIMDCEGAERSILRALTDRPPVVIVETHPSCGVPTEETRSLLQGLDYEITEFEYAPDDEQKKVLSGRHQ